MLRQITPPEDPFGNCPAGGIQWPHLLEVNTDQSQIGQIVEPKEMMKAGQYIVLANGRYQQSEGDSKYTTTVEWNVNFKRVGKLKGN